MKPAVNDRPYLIASIASAGAGVVALGIGSALGFVAKSKLSDSNNGPCNADNQCSPAGLALRADALHAANGGTAAFVIGGVAIAAGVVVFLVRPRASSTTGSLQLAPTATWNSAGLSLHGAF